MSQANKCQMGMLTKYMEEHPDLAKSYNCMSSVGRAVQKQQWEKLTHILNANGPPRKSVAEWKRAWTVRKYITRRKLAQNKASLMKTGGGPVDLKTIDATDEAISAACGLEASMHGIQGAQSFGSFAKETNVEEDLNSIFNTIIEDVEDDTTKQRCGNSKPPPTKKIGQEEIFKKQIELQEQFFAKQVEQGEKMNTTLIAIKDAIREFVNDKKNNNKAFLEMRGEELKMRTLELEAAKMSNDLKRMELNEKH